MTIAGDAKTTLLPQLGTLEALLSGADERENKPLRSNAHIHLPPNFSAFDTVSQALDLAAQQGIEALGVSNYYDFQVYRDFADEAREHGVFPLYGLEVITRIEDLLQSGVKVNDPGNPGKMYLCGKGITGFAPMNDEACDLLAVIRQNDSERMAAMTLKLSRVFADRGLETGLTASAIKARVARRHDCPPDTVYLQERHLAQAFQEVLFERTPEEERASLLARLFSVPSQANLNDAVAVQGEIRSHLMKAGKAAFADETFVGFDHAYRLILSLGGIPCYPTLADGAAPICAFETPPDLLIRRIKERGIHCAELIPIRNTPAVLGEYVRAMRQAELVVTAGTEHNTLDLLPLDPTCLNGEPIPEDVRAIFQEGTCVVAAHQYLTLAGQPGFVDASGALNPAYPSANERIAAFARLGAAVIGRYREEFAHPTETV
ncbi:MAG: hypothetical protein H7Z41_10970 [Cytophagales bacterium]|nr:hypothetical protein [Armatimonadota bacterium]